MGQITANISGAALPYSVVVRKLGETTGNRCTSGCNSFPIDFTHDSGNNNYYFIVTDANDCVIDSRDENGGISNINCDVTQPSFDAEIIQPICDGTDYEPAILRLTNIVDAASYKICYNTLTMDCAACTVRDGSISTTSLDIVLDTPTIATSRGVLFRAYTDATCDAYKEYFGTIVTPECETTPLPNWSDMQILPPYCSPPPSSVIQNATLRVIGITNATRYKVCYNSTDFSICNSTCSSSDGFITGPNIDISIAAPASGVKQFVLVRFYNGSSCDFYVDRLIDVYSTPCDKTSLIILDMSFASGGACTIPAINVNCNPAGHANDYDLSLKLETSGTTENGQIAITKGGSNRMIPNGNTIPNVFVVAAPNISCGLSQSTFYRLQVNMSYLRSKYPLINEFTFGVYANKIKGTGGLTLTPQTNKFKGVFMKKKPVNTGCDGITLAATCAPVDYTDAGREPCDPAYIGDLQPRIEIPYLTSVTGNRKIAILTYNFTTDTVGWNSVTQV